MTPNWPWTLQRQITLYLYNNCSQVSNFTLFRSTTSRFGVTGHFETRAPNNLQMTLNTTRSEVQKYTTYVLLVSQSPKCWSVLLYDQRFPWCSTFYNSPLTPKLNAAKRTKKMPKIQIWKFTILFTNLVETLLRSMPEFWRANLLCTFKQDVVWSFFSPKGSMLMKTKTKFKNLKFEISSIFIQLW